MGGLGNFVTGFAAERIGLFNSMLLVSGLPMLAALCTIVLPSHRAVANASRAARTNVDQLVDGRTTVTSEAAGR